MKRMSAVIALVLTVVAVYAQTVGDTVISVVNCYAGRDIYQLEGHTALRVQLPNGNDVAVNFGLFDFEKPHFVYNFVSGNTDYFAGAIPWQYFYMSYAQEGRRVVEHELHMDSVQKQRMLQLLQWFLLPENATYRYNYVKDNCATRPLRLVEMAMGDTLLMGEPGIPADDARTFRQVMRHYHRNYPWYQFGIDLALGPGIDYPIDRRETTFAPTLLDTQLAGATVGGSRPLVKATHVLYDADPEAAIDSPTPWLLSPMGVGLILLIITMAVTVCDLRRRRTTRWFDATLYGVYGVTGLVLTFLIFISTHEATSPNFNYLWLNPLCFIPTICLWWRSGRRAVWYYQVVNLGVLIVGAVAWFFLPQSANPAFAFFVAADILRAASYVYLNQPKARN